MMLNQKNYFMGLFALYIGIFCTIAGVIFFYFSILFYPMDGYESLILIDGAWIFGGTWIAYENGVKHFDKKKRMNKAGISMVCLGIIIIIEAIILMIWSFYFIFPIPDYSKFIVIPMGLVIGGIFCIYKGKKLFAIRQIYSDAFNDVDQ